MAYVENLRAARDRYAEELALRTGPPGETRWDEYERWLLEQIERINALLDRADESGDGQDGQIAGAGWTIRQAATGVT